MATHGSKTQITLACLDLEFQTLLRIDDNLAIKSKHRHFSQSEV